MDNECLNEIRTMTSELKDQILVNSELIKELKDLISKNKKTLEEVKKFAHDSKSASQQSKDFLFNVLANIVSSEIVLRK